MVTDDTDHAWGIKSRVQSASFPGETSGWPIGRSAEVTAARGNYILELNGQPALQVMREMWKLMEREHRALPIQIGMSEDGSESDYLARNIRFDPLGQAVLASSSSKPPLRLVFGMPLLQVACDEVQTGTRVQLLVRDPAWGRQALEADLQGYLQGLPSGISPEQGTLGGLLYSCVESQQQEHRILTSAFPALPWQGCMVQGEFGPLGKSGSPAAMHSFSSSLGFLRQSTLPATS
ncbi:hypothetical protein WJX84_002063 [Apatococcus fuscideae]|uniref:PDZ domain-containing protein n=1 Tax=Apatococcus fuscideae TaxID=2026836 RepID=A0AAW1RG10_9CHLO